MTAKTASNNDHKGPATAEQPRDAVTFTPRFDIWETNDELVLSGDLPGVAADHDYSQDTLLIDGQSVDPKFGWVMTYPFNMLSRCPVLNLPIGRASNSVPIGMQLVGPTYEDEVVFQFGTAYEAQCQAEPQSNPFINPSNRPVIG